MRRVAIALAALALAGLLTPRHAAAGQYERLARSVLALYTRNPAPQPPAPVVPSPKPGVCQDCNGKGTVGDGRTAVTCQTCKGTGKTTAAQAPPTGSQRAAACADGSCTLPARRGIFGGLFR